MYKSDSATWTAQNILVPVALVAVLVSVLAVSMVWSHIACCALYPTVNRAWGGNLVHQVGK
jgi:hypothetical protein